MELESGRRWKRSAASRYLATMSYIWDDIHEIWREGMDVLRDPQSIH